MADAVEKPRFRIRTDGVISGVYLPGKAALNPGLLNRRDAGRHDLTEFNGWAPGLSFAGSDAFGEADTILGRARDIDQNNGWINAGIDRRVEAVIGGAIRLSAQPAHELLNRDYQWRMKWTADVQARFKVWGADIERRCDARQRFNFGTIAKLAYLTYVRDGEAFAEIRDNKRGIANTTNVLLVEPERVSNPNDQPDSKNLRRGIEYDENGAAVAYHVRSGHPGDPVANMDVMRWTRVAARGKTGRSKFLHVFSARRVEQMRGVSRLAEAMLPAKMLDRVDRAEVNTAMLAALFSLFIKSPGTTDDLEAALAPSASGGQIDPWIDAYLSMRGKTPVRVPGAQVNHLFPGEEVIVPPRNNPNTNWADFASYLQRKVAGSIGVATPHVTGDWSGINYSSARALLNEIWRSFLEDRSFFCQQFLTPIYAAWLEVEVANGDVKVPGGPANFYRSKTAITMAEWIGPGRGSVDPLKEANANNKDIAAGRKSTVAAILEDGRDPSDVLSEERWYRSERENMGLPPINHDIKAGDGGDGAGDSGGEAGGTAEDRDGDGVAMEDQKPAKKKGLPQ
jgi:lambda family phage portal protein